jgi:UDP-galactopyranose mutase
MPSLVVLSHLRWDFVFQRPQHLMTRFAKSGKILFLEEPVFDPGVAPFVEISEPHPNIKVVKPHLDVPANGYGDEEMALLAPLLKATVDKFNADGNGYSAWMYTPMALPLLEVLSPQIVIYDCMDELSAFAKAPAALKQRERALLQRADLVFTGGPSLYKAKRTQHRAAYCFPSAVDAKHFSRGADEANAFPALADIPHPRLGFFGVVDERFDRELLAALAKSRPQWQFCIVGPVVKIDAALLPREANIHYFGQQAYADLPAFIAGWDVCLLLFALNDATRFISPTKTLEYMAAEHPVVSTPVTDVVDLYGEYISVARSPAEFIGECERLLHESPKQRNARKAAMRKCVEKYSWDSTAAAMQAIIVKAIADSQTDAQFKSSSTSGVLQQRTGGGTTVLEVVAGGSG